MIESLECLELLASDTLERPVFVYLFLDEHVFDRGIRDVSRDASTRELLLQSAARQTGAQGPAASKLSCEAGIIQKPCADEAFDGRRHLVRWLSFADQGPLQLRRGPGAQSEQIERAIVGGRECRLAVKRPSEQIVDRGAHREMQALDRVDREGCRGFAVDKHVEATIPAR